MNDELVSQLFQDELVWMTMQIFFSRSSVLDSWGFFAKLQRWTLAQYERQGEILDDQMQQLQRQLLQGLA
jgi:hypothetical protein